MTNETVLGDERRTSWKVLLPFVSGTRILVLGGDTWIVQSLARSCAKVDWFFDGRDCDLRIDFDENSVLSGERVHLLESLDGNLVTYDVVVIADKKWLSLSVLKTILTFLKPAGILVHVGLSFRPWKRKKFLRCGLDHYLFLSALPVPTPRLFFPLLPSKFCQLSLSFHVPGSRKARFVLALFKIAARFGFNVPLRQRGVVFCSRDEFQGGIGTLALWLSERLSLQIDNIAVYCGSESPRRKMTLLVGAVGPDGPVSLVVKVADSVAGNAAIQQESATLRYLDSCSVGCEYPQLLLEGSWSEHSVQVQQAFSPNLDFVGSVFGSDHILVLASFSQIARKTISIMETREWCRVEKVFQGSRDSFPPELQLLWKHCLSQMEKYGDIIPVHFVHGDFTSWNMRCQNGRLAIFDWEDSLLQGLPFYDLFRFLYRQASLVGPWPGGEQFYSLLMEKIESLVGMANIDFPVVYRVLPLLIMNEYLERPHSDLLDVAVSFQVDNG